MIHLNAHSLVWGLVLTVVAQTVPTHAQKAKAVPPQMSLNWPSQSLIIPPDAPPGELVYPLRLATRKATGGFWPFELRRVRTGIASAESKSDEPAIMTAQEPYPFASLFSPNGRSLLLEFTSPTSFLDEYQFVVWNAKTRKTQQGPQMRFYPEVKWSPDSCYIAYFQGGDQYGEETNGTSPLELNVFDTITGESHRVVRNPEAVSFAWTYQHTLLYTFKPQKAGESVYGYTMKRPSIYEASVSGTNATQIIPDGSSPSPSPDGRWVAFVGWSVIKKKAVRLPASPKSHQSSSAPNQFGLFLYDRRRQTRTFVHSLSEMAPDETIAWTSDSKRMLSIRDLYINTHPPAYTSSDQKVYPGYGKITLELIAVPSLAAHTVAVIPTYDETGRFTPRGQYRFGGFSADETTAYLYVEELRHGFLLNSLKYIRLRTGTVGAIFEGKGVQDITWRETTAQRVPN